MSMICVPVGQGGRTVAVSIANIVMMEPKKTQNSNTKITLNIPRVPSEKEIKQAGEADRSPDCMESVWTAAETDDLIEAINEAQATGRVVMVKI